MLHDSVKRHNSLHGAFTERRRIAYNYRASVILQRACENFGSRSAETTRQDNERSIIECGPVVVGSHLDVAIRSAHLHDWAGRNEKPGEIDGFGERAATVTSDIKNNPGNLLLLQFFQKTRDIFRSRRCGTASVAAIKSRQINHADPLCAAFLAR